MKNIAVITASRADYGIFLPVFRALTDAKFNWHLVHMNDREYTGFPYVADWHGSCFFSDEYDRPDAILVLGDTMPMLQAAMWAVERNITVCHIHGGDTTGSIDNKIRYAISALADWHFPSLPQHGSKLEAMGYPSERIRVVGPLGIYAMQDAAFIPGAELRKKLGLSNKPIIIVIQHPVSGEREHGEKMEATLDALQPYKKRHEILVFYPNGEEGSESMIMAMQHYPFRTFKNLPYLEFISLLRISKLIVGNSSSGLVEAPLFGVPCVNIGTRQNGRIGGRNVLNSGCDSLDIKKSIEWQLRDGKELSKNPYQLDIDGTGIIIRTLE